MFTGLIQAVGALRRRAARDAGVRLEIETPAPLESLVLGESIAVDGACLTVVSFAGSSFEVDVSPETLARTTLGGRRPGDPLHLERSLRLGDRLGGHIVLGHVDGVGVLRERRTEGDYTFLRYDAPGELLPYLVEKGSIAIDGVSLTLNAVRGPGLEVAIIPHTASHTHLTRTALGEGVNLETDMLAKHVARLLEAWRGGGSTGAAGGRGGVTFEVLEKHGFTRS